MLKVRSIFIELLLTAALATNALAETPRKLSGMWILDAAATEQSFSNTPRPPNAHKVAEWLGTVGGYMSLFSYQFIGETVVEDAYGGRGKRSEYRLVSNQGAELTYAQIKPTAGQGGNTLAVTILKNGRLRIVKSGLGETMGYLLWKRSPVTNEQVTRDDVMAASEIWIKSMRNIVKLLRDSPN